MSEVKRVPKRQDYISWDEYFMGLAILSGKRSKDPSTQVGACIVDKNNRILSIGYNGLPRGLSDDEISWKTEGDISEIRDPYICHAEINAILNFRGTTLESSTIYVDMFPCYECTKAIIQAGINQIVYYRLRNPESEKHKIALKMLNSCGVKIRKYMPTGRNIELNV